MTVLLAVVARNGLVEVKRLMAETIIGVVAEVVAEDYRILVIATLLTEVEEVEVRS